MKTFISDISRKEFPSDQKISAKTIRPSILATIQKENPSFGLASNLAVSELNKYRQKYIGDYLMREVGELNELEQYVLGSLKNHTIITDKAEEGVVEEYTFAQKMTDKVASFGGSWKFITLFVIFLLLWVLVNTAMYFNKPFDPYPFILLNLILSCTAALQAPVIMMSQNRQDEKDRDRAKKDYMINLKSELEIRMLHEKLDHLIIHQQHELLEIQKVQVEMMNDIMTRMK
ncbi:MAG: DUF1003 domain-containing protein [Cytophagales bacterium]|jgi:uncharacterized membrane protein|nr:DUF1003 domain-containing protein [Bacteroidota bacterium]MBS1980416.1 DUF1003 domain-containing protein [Bacteroidota bacterium]WHZ07730.1 MAG: DUF1003 domain-containing protein [Cytophagales bacterium]